MKTQQKNPFLPFVTAEQIVAFQKDEKATWTASRFLNAVLLAMEAVGVGTSQKVADYLGMKPAMVSMGTQIVCGMNLSQLRTVYAIKRVAQLQKEHPDWMSDKIARHIGFDNRASIWNIVHNHKNAAIVNMIDPHLADEKRRQRPNYSPDQLQVMYQEFLKEKGLGHLNNTKT